MNEQQRKHNDDFNASISSLKDVGYYWGPIKHDTAEKLLKLKSDGSFLLRDSRHDNYLLTISFKWQGSIYHVRIEHIDSGKFNFQDNFDSYVDSQPIVAFIDTIMRKSHTNHTFYIQPRLKAPGIHVKFLHPVSRFREMPVSSLQHLTRFSILKYVRKDNIDKLNLPNKLKTYLKENQIFTELGKLK